jgi:hypothetical protein
MSAFDEKKFASSNEKFECAPPTGEFPHLS